jgi:hypothetical protein
MAVENPPLGYQTVFHKAHLQERSIHEKRGQKNKNNISVNCNYIINDFSPQSVKHGYSNPDNVSISYVYLITLIIGYCNIHIIGIFLHINLVGYHHPQYCQPKNPKIWIQVLSLTTSLSEYYNFALLKIIADKLEKAWELRRSKIGEKIYYIFNVFKMDITILCNRLLCIMSLR